MDFLPQSPRRATRRGILADSRNLSIEAMEVPVARGFLSFIKRRGSQCWRYGDERNGTVRRLDGQPFICGDQKVKALPEQRGVAWHWAIGTTDVVTRDLRDVIVTEGAPDALAAFHFAWIEGRWETIGVLCLLGEGTRIPHAVLIAMKGRRIRIVADATSGGMKAAMIWAKQLAPFAASVDIVDLRGLRQVDGSPVKDLNDLTRVHYDDFEACRELWDITNLDAKGGRFIPYTPALETPLFASDVHRTQDPLPDRTQETQEAQETHERQEGKKGEKEKNTTAMVDAKWLEGLGKRFATTAHDTARERRFALLRQIHADEKTIGRKLQTRELRLVFNAWHAASLPTLDPLKSRDDYLMRFLAEYGAVRVPAGEGGAIEAALRNMRLHPLPDIPDMPDASEDLRRVAALHCEMARASGNGIYFLSVRDTGRAIPHTSADSANRFNKVLCALGVIKEVHRGRYVPNGKNKATEWRYLLDIPPLPPQA